MRRGRTRNAALALVMALVWVAAPPVVQAKSDVESTVAPPPTRTETIPKHKAGYVWAPGYWSWNERGHKHVWVPGRLLRDKRGARWVPDQWEEKNGRYHFTEGHWEPRPAGAASRR
jgi:hypothetical protein